MHSDHVWSAGPLFQWLYHSRYKYSKVAKFLECYGELIRYYSFQLRFLNMDRAQQGTPPALPYRSYPAAQSLVSREQEEKAPGSRDQTLSYQQTYPKLPSTLQAPPSQPYSQQAHLERVQASRPPPQRPQKPAALSKDDGGRRQIEKEGEALTFE